MNNRTVIKQDLRTIAEVGVEGVLGRIPRRLRRSAGRQFANEAYRYYAGLPRKNFRANPAVIDWIVKQYEGYQLSKTSSEADRGDATDNGSADQSVAAESTDGQGHEETLGDQ